MPAKLNDVFGMLAIECDFNAPDDARPRWADVSRSGSFTTTGYINADKIRVVAERRAAKIVGPFTFDAKAIAMTWSEADPAHTAVFTIDDRPRFEAWAKLTRETADWLEQSYRDDPAKFLDALAALGETVTIQEASGIAADPRLP